MSKWKKVGSVHSGDQKSNRSGRSRSRDQMPTVSFHDNVNRIKMSSQQLIIDSQNTYFCENYISRKKSPESHRSLSRIKTQRSLNSGSQQIFTAMKSILSKKKTHNDQNMSHLSSGKQDAILQSKYFVHEIDRKLRRFPKQSQLQEVKKDYQKLKSFVKHQVDNFKKSFVDLAQELKYQINFQKYAKSTEENLQIAKQRKPIVPYKFNSRVLENMNFQSKNQNDQNENKNIYVLDEIRTQVRLCIDSFQELQREKEVVLEKYSDINLSQLLA